MTVPIVLHHQFHIYVQQIREQWLFARIVINYLHPACRKLAFAKILGSSHQVIFKNSADHILNYFEKWVRAPAQDWVHLEFFRRPIIFQISSGTINFLFGEGQKNSVFWMHSCKLHQKAVHSVALWNNRSSPFRFVALWTRECMRMLLRCGHVLKKSIP